MARETDDQRNVQSPAVESRDEPTLIGDKTNDAAETVRRLTSDGNKGQNLAREAEQSAAMAAEDQSSTAATDSGPNDPTLLSPGEPPDDSISAPLLEHSGEASASATVPLPQVPGYELLDELGHGGMGVVFRARHLSLNRIVALKMLIAGPLATPALLARFRVEAESVARLKHSGIVQIYEIGEFHGQPYFSLEFVSGGSLADKLDGTPWSPRAAAQLIEQLASSMHFAHEAGIVHRDLKPANVLLDDSGTPKITDFGLAKQIDGGSQQTRTGEIVGTPSYMAPEQASGVTKRLTPACDVYALGAILYELLTGRPPFRGQDPLDTVMMVISDEPVAPRRLLPKIPHDLETICLKCLDKSPQRRYASAAELEADLRRFRLGDPIVARPVTAVERGVKWARRRPAVAALVAVSVLAGVVFLMGNAFYSAALRREVDRADRKADEAQANFLWAKDNLAAALDVVDQILADVSSDRLIALPENEQLRREMLDRALLFSRRLLNENPDEPQVKLQVARAQRQVADIRQMQDELDAAEAAYEKALAMLAPLVDELPGEPRSRRELAAAHTNLGNLLARRGELDGAENHYRNALKLWRPLHDETLGKSSFATSPPMQRPANSDTDRRLADYRQQLARTLANLGVVLQRTAHPEEAEAAYEQSFALYTSSGDELPGTFDGRVDLAIAQINYGMTLTESGQFDRAVDALRKAQHLLNTPEATLNNHPHARFALASSENNLGTALLGSENVVEAEQAYRRAAEQFDQLVADYAASSVYQHAWCENRNNLAMLLARLGKTNEALAALDAVETRSEALAERFPDEPGHQDLLAASLEQQALILDETGDTIAAVESITEALDHREALEKQHPADLALKSRFAKLLHSSAELLAARDRLGDAARYLNEAVHRQRAALDASGGREAYRRELGRHLRKLAEVCVDLGEPGQAAEAADQLVALFPNNSDEKLNAAGLLATCIPLITGVKAMEASPDPDKSLRDYCGDRTIELLREAVEQRQITVDELKSSSQFAALADDEDFQAFIDQLDSKEKSN